VERRSAAQWAVQRHLESARLSRIRRTLRFAALQGRIFHLWWHPHNFGLHPEENLRFLRGVLTEFAHCRQRYGMRSLSMADVDAEVRGVTNSETPTGAAAIARPAS
jgi:hypothetical protein